MLATSVGTPCPGPVAGYHGGSLVASEVSGDKTEDNEDLRVVISTDGGDWCWYCN